MKTMKRTKTMVECALMVALSTVLSLFSVVHLPYGGSVTVASMLPVVLIAYRHGLGWGLGTGAVFAVIQQLLGLNNLTYFTTWQSVVAVILLDYLVAFTVAGLGGIFRRATDSQSLALASGSLLACVLRYICHVISGATVWAGLSIPTEAALVYSIGYNATYMIPEAVILVLAAYYVGSLLDFRREQVVRLTERRTATPVCNLLGALSGLFAIVAVAVDVSLVFSHMQNADSGEFDVRGLEVELFAGSFWMGVVIVTAVAVVAITAMLLVRSKLLKSAKTAETGKENA